MRRKGQLHIYTHHYLSITKRVSGHSGKNSGTPKHSRRNIILRIILFLLSPLYWMGFSIGMLCYFSGRLLIWVARLPFNIFKLGAGAARVEFKKTGESVRTRKTLFTTHQARFGLVLFSCLVLVGSGAVKSAQLFAWGMEIKGKVLGVATSGSKHLISAQGALESQDTQTAQTELARASESFRHSRQEIESVNILMKSLLNILPQKKAGAELLKAGNLVSEAGGELLAFYEHSKNFSYSPEGLMVRGDAEKEFTSMSLSLGSATDKLTQALEVIDNVSAGSIPENYRGEFIELQGKVGALKKTLTSTHELFTLARQLLTGQKNVLLVFQNNNELRATGGFIGTYGNLILENGHINKLRISSIYDLDGQLSEAIKPPTPMLNVNNRWYLRDSNWFAHFPDSAKKITTFYEKEGGETPDLVIAVTPQLIIDTLKLTGPVQMEGFGVTLTPENFVEQTQVSTSVSNDSPVNAPKEILAQFFPILLQRLAVLEPRQYPLLLEVLLNNLNSKHVIFYSRDEGLQKRLSAYNWTGEIRETDRDYLSIVSSNLGGTKTDLFVEQRIELDSHIQPDGSVRNELTITRTNRLPKMSHTHNSSFIRVFVPIGSKLINSSGFDYKNLDTTQLQGLKNDRDVLEWESGIVREIIGGTMIGKEAGKTFFGNWQNLAGGESKTIKITYSLPFTIKNTDRFSLLMQKQMGALSHFYKYNLSFSGRKMEWTNFSAASMETGRVTAEELLDSDRFFGVVLTER